MCPRLAGGFASRCQDEPSLYDEFAICSHSWLDWLLHWSQFAIQSMLSVYLCFVNWDDCKCVRYEIIIYDPYIYYGVLDMQIEMIVNVYEKRWFCVRYAQF